MLNIETMVMEVDSTLEKNIHKSQLTDGKILEIKQLLKEEKVLGFTKDDKGVVWFKK